MKKAMVILALGAGLLWACSQRVDPNLIQMNALTEQGAGPAIGTIRVAETPHGVLFTPDLRNLTPGVHGFHLHAEGDCSPLEQDGRMVPGLAAGGHYDPEGTGTHQGPYGDGHLGDLPALTAAADGTVTLPVLAPRLKLSDLKGRALVIHAGGDTYSDHPPMGGGGERVACGVVAP